VARRHNPLWRSTDSWRSRLRVLLVLCLAVAVGLSVLLAFAHYQVDRAGAQRVAATLHEVHAVALTDADRLHSLPDAVFTAEVRWTAPGGASQQARAGVKPTTAAGDRVTVWLDRNGHPATPPTSTADSAGNAAFLGLLVLIGSTSVLMAGGAFARARLASADMCHWEQDWQQVAPEWTGRKRPE
jgi:hypothetical protein